MRSLLDIGRVLRVLVVPFDGLAQALRARLWGVPLILLSLTPGLSGWLSAMRWDAAPYVRAAAEAQPGEPNLSERELDERVQTERRVRAVLGALAGLMWPMLMLAFAGAGKLAVWLLGRRISLRDAIVATALALLPMALYHGMLAAALAAGPPIADAQRATLLPSSLLSLWPDAKPGLAGLLTTLDFFKLWAAALFGVGLSAASGMAPWRGLSLGLLLYAMFASVALVGGPALLGGAS